MVSTSAWNPYPITLVTWLMIILLDKLRTDQTSKLLWLGLGFISGLGFHFSTAFAVLYPILVVIGCLLRKIRPKLITCLLFLFGFILPFLPQIAFELRHNFSQTKAVVAYVTGKVEIETQVKPTFIHVMSLTLAEIKSAVLPNISKTQAENILGFVILLFFIFYAFVTIVHFKNTKLKSITQLKIRVLELILATLLSIVWLTVTHFNSWYLLGLMPWAIVFVAEIIRFLPKRYLVIFSLFLISSSFFTFRQVIEEKEKFVNDRAFLPTKLKAIDIIYKKAENRAFSSYHYARHIYDFDYQYLYFWQAKMGKKLPFEFAYEPNVTPYIAQKENLLKFFKEQQDFRQPELIFYLVEEPLVERFLEEWWQRQQYDSILETLSISDQLTLYVAKPKI